MSYKKSLQLSVGKRTSLKDQPKRQSYSSLDKLDKKQSVNTKLTNTIQQKKSSPSVQIPDKQVKTMEWSGSNKPEDWPTSNKRRYLKNYQLPKINSPTKLRHQKTSKYEQQPIQNLSEDEEKLVKQKETFVVETNSPTKKRLQSLKQHYQTTVRTKAGTNGKQTKINQDVAIVEQKLPLGLKLYCVCDGHGLNGHHVTAFIKVALIKNLNGLLKKYHNPPQKQKMIQFLYNALQMTNQQILDGDINTQLAGSTVIAVFVYQQRVLSFNVGDSRAILLQQVHTNFVKESTEEGKLPKLSHMKIHQQYEWKIVPLSDDQKPDRPDQKERILKFGGRVFAQTGDKGQQLGPTRVWMKDVMMPGLAMTRSFGDKAGIKAGTNGQPQLTEHVLCAEDKAIIIASDGVWQYLENDEVMNTLIPFLMKDDINTAADVLLRKSVNVWAKMNFARDDITFIIVKINAVNR